MTCDDVRDLAPAFVLGALSRDDEAAVRSHLAECTAAHAEIDELGGTAQAMALTSDPIEPPVELRERIMAAAAATPQLPAGIEATAGASPTVARGSTAAPGSSDDRTAPRRDVLRGDVVAFPADRRRTAAAAWAVRIAAVLAIVALAGWNLVLQGQLGAERDADAAVAAVLRVAAQPGAESAILRPATPGGPEGVAALSADGSMSIAVRNLVPTSGSQVYEAWFIPTGGAPIPVGSFTVGSSGAGAMTGGRTPGGVGATIALTLEPTAGSTAPTGPIVTSGTSTAASG